jgi:HEAT repeat protein
MYPNKLIHSTRYFLLTVGVFFLFLKAGVFAETGERNLDASKQNMERDITDLKTKDREARLKAIKRLAAGNSPQAVAPLIEALKDSDFQLRQYAAFALGEIGNRGAVEPLLIALDDFNFRVRAAAAAALGKIADTRSVMPLFIAMGDNHREVSEPAARSLENLGIYGAVNFYNCLQWSDEAIKEFREIKDWRLIEYIISAFPHWDAVKREDVIWIIGKIKEDRITDFLIKNLANKITNIRAAAAWRLEDYGAAKAADALILALDDDMQWVREAAAYALEQTGDLSGVDSLIKLLQNDKSPAVREAAAWSLGKKDDERALNALNMALGDETEMVRIAAASGLGRFADPRSIDPLTKVLRDKRLKVRKTAAQSLSMINDDRSVYSLIVALEDASPIVRRTAAKGLEKSGNILAIDPLIRALPDDDPEVRQIVSSALKKLGEPLGPLVYAGMQGDKIALAELIKVKDYRAIIPMIIALNRKDHRIRRTAAWYLGEIRELRAVDDLTKMAAGYNILDRFYGMAALAKLNFNSIIKIIYSGFIILFSVWTLLYFLLITILTWIILYIRFLWPTKKSVILGIALGCLIFGILFSLPSLSFTFNYLIYLTIGLLPFLIANLGFRKKFHRFNYHRAPANR